LIGDGISGTCASNLEEQASKRSELKATAEGNMDSNDLTSVSVGTSWYAFAHLFALRERELFACYKRDTNTDRDVSLSNGLLQAGLKTHVDCASNICISVSFHQCCVMVGVCIYWLHMAFI
jgi:hypothetical protein